MPYSQFTTIRAVKRHLGLQVLNSPLFGDFPPVQPSAWLNETLERTLQQRVGYFSEKARSEAIVFPLLIELKTRNENLFTLYSGAILEADREKGLNGECDFILGFGKQNIEIEAPVFCIVEAKDNDLELGVPQCIAQMYGARLFNQQDGVAIPTMYGGVTTGEAWLFLKLEGNSVFVDVRQFYLDRADELLGALEWIVKQQVATALVVV